MLLGVRDGLQGEEGVAVDVALSNAEFGASVPDT